MIRLCLFSFIVLFTFASCEKDCDDDSQDNSMNSYEPMALGNYWVYQVSVEQQDGSIDTLERLDTVKIVGQDIVNDKAYYRYESTSSEIGYNASSTYYRADSLGYIIDEKGKIYFSPNTGESALQTFEVKSGDILVFTFDFQMADETSSISVPAGTFETKSFIGTATPWGSFIDSYECTEMPYHLYSQGIGRVKSETFFASSCTSYYKELVDFQLQ